MRWGGPFCKIYKTGNPTENEEILSFTCWWFGKCSMAFRSKWVTSARSRTGMPAARSCLVRLKTHALAANCTGKFRGWFLIPMTTSWNAQALPTLASYTFVHVLQEQSTATWRHSNDSQHPISASLKWKNPSGAILFLRRSIAFCSVIQSWQLLLFQVLLRFLQQPDGQAARNVWDS